MTGEFKTQINFNFYGAALTDEVDAMLAYWDKNLVCRFANKAYLDWFGKTKDEMVDKIKLNELLGDELYGKNLKYISGALAGTRQTFEREIAITVGEIRSSLANYFPDIVDGEVKGFYLHVADITPIKQLEKELMKTKELEAENRELELRNKLLNNFIFHTYHTMKEPLRHISGFLQVLQRRAKEKLTEEEIDLIKESVVATKKMESNIIELRNKLMYDKT